MEAGQPKANKHRVLTTSYDWYVDILKREALSVRYKKGGDLNVLTCPLPEATPR